MESMGNGFDNEAENPYTMNIAVQPPPEVRPGALLDTPIVVLLDSQRPQDADDPNFWGLISVVSADGMQALSPPQPDLLSGTLVDSIHSTSVDGGSRLQRFLSFSNVSINREGNYRIRVCLVRMQSAQSEAVNMQSVVTRVVSVNANASAHSVGNSTFQLVVCRAIAKDHQVKKRNVYWPLSVFHKQPEVLKSVTMRCSLLRGQEGGLGSDFLTSGTVHALLGDFVLIDHITDQSWVVLFVVDNNVTLTEK